MVKQFDDPFFWSQYERLSGFKTVWRGGKDVTEELILLEETQSIEGCRYVAYALIGISHGRYKLIGEFSFANEPIPSPSEIVDLIECRHCLSSD